MLGGGDADVGEVVIAREDVRSTMGGSRSPLDLVCQPR
jgi:hypothetical protein